jgi:hypothetical protein
MAGQWGKLKVVPKAVLMAVRSAGHLVGSLVVLTELRTAGLMAAVKAAATVACWAAQMAET